MKCVLMPVRERRQKGLRVSHFALSFSSDIMAAKGLITADVDSFFVCFVFSYCCDYMSSDEDWRGVSLREGQMSLSKQTAHAVWPARFVIYSLLKKIFSNSNFLNFLNPPPPTPPSIFFYITHMLLRVN